MLEENVIMEKTAIPSDATIGRSTVEERKSILKTKRLVKHNIIFTATIEVNNVKSKPNEPGYRTHSCGYANVL